MKKLLALLSVLCLNLAGFAQTSVDFYIKNARTGANLYTVTVQRNESTYPYTVAKNSEFRAAVAAGSIARTTAEGCVIPAGVKAPLTKPTCSAPTGPSYASASYGFDGERLTVNATVTVSGGDNVKMRFENADGSGFSILNPDNVLIDNNTFYYGAEPTATTRRWVVKVPNASPKKITIRLESTQSVYSTTFTPIVGATNTQLFTASTTPVAGCNFALSVNSPSVGCGVNATLIATASGSDANGLTYNWSSGQTTPSVTFGGVSSNGSYTYTVTASKAGCSPKTAVSTVTVSGCTTTTTPTLTAGYGNAYGPNSNYVELPQQGRVGSGEVNNQYNRVYLSPPTSNGVTVGFNLTGAGFIDYLSIPGIYEGKNQVNSYFWNYPNGLLDAGRQIQDGPYSYPPGSGVEWTDPITGQRTHGIGWNPIAGGNEGSKGEFSDLKVFHKGSNLVYTKVQPNQWDLSMVRSQMYIENWVKHDPADPLAVRKHARWTMFRNDPDSDHFPDVRTNEAPCFFVTCDFQTVMYATGKPYTGNWRAEQRPIGQATQLRTTEPCMAVVDNRTGKGWALYAPMSGRFGHNNDTQGWDTSKEWQFNLVYLASAPNLILDKTGVYDIDAAFKYGTVDELKNWCYAQPRWTGTFNYVFNQKSRLGWYYNHAGDQLEKNVDSYLEVYPQYQGDQQGRDMKAMSPETWINGESVKQIIIDAEFINGSSEMKIVWSNPDSPTIERSRTFSVTPNGGRKTYTVNMSGVSGWDGAHILGFGIQYNDPNPGNYPDITNVKWRFYSIKSGQ